MRLKNKVAVVTEPDEGIGESIVIRLWDVKARPLPRPNAMAGKVNRICVIGIGGEQGRRCGRRSRRIGKDRFEWGRSPHG